MKSNALDCVLIQSTSVLNEKWYLILLQFVDKDVTKTVKQRVNHEI